MSKFILATMSTVLVLFSLKSHARVDFKSECTVEGKKICITEYKVGKNNYRERTPKEPECETKASEAIAQKTCLLFAKEQEMEKARRELQREKEQAIYDQKVSLTRTWECTGKQMESKLKLRFLTVETPKSADGNEMDTERRYFGDLGFDCAGNPGTLFFILSKKGNSLVGTGTSGDCKAEEGGNLTAKISVPLIGSQPGTPIDIKALAGGETYDMSNNSCTFSGSEVVKGNNNLEGSEFKSIKEETISNPSSR